jgi:hypothetical protein
MGHLQAQTLGAWPVINPGLLSRSGGYRALIGAAEAAASPGPGVLLLGA